MLSGQSPFLRYTSSYCMCQGSCDLGRSNTSTGTVLAYPVCRLSLDHVCDQIQTSIVNTNQGVLLGWQHSANRFVWSRRNASGWLYCSPAKFDLSILTAAHRLQRPFCKHTTQRASVLHVGGSHPAPKGFTWHGVPSALTSAHPTGYTTLLQPP